MDNGLEFLDTNNKQNESNNTVLNNTNNDFYDKEIMDVDDNANLLDDDFESIGEELNNENFSSFVDSSNNDDLKPAEFDSPIIEEKEPVVSTISTSTNDENSVKENNTLKEEKVSEQIADNASESNKNEIVSSDQKNIESNDVLSDFDSLYNNLYTDVVGANNFISNLIEKKTSLNRNEKSLEEIKTKFEKEKAEFDKYVAEQKNIIEKEKQQCDEYVSTQRQRIESEEAKFNEDVLAKNTELDLLEQSLNITKEQLETEKEQFEDYKKVEEEKIRNDKNKLESDKNQFEKEKELTQKSLKERQDELATKEQEFAKFKDLEQSKMDSEKEQFEKETGVIRQGLENSQKELSFKQEQFAKYKEIEEKKLELENKNLAQSCARFKTLVSQFNTSFAKLPNDKE